ncbi:hypothetical protein DEIPH_ctg025orf0031 [Deinococcus phoenicis]|uniref:Uncharacterized protein n=1 Tax=Deinococcus phoenicis TaxID=1476583 RepID=A0A016QQN8_9DEIO|nr:hypothetical protein DEIPH_ctg025orf0031 [Deinococcus phoenicis]
MLGLLTACAPATTTPKSSLAAQATLQGSQLTVTVVNTGPYDLLLEDGCPRPFTAGFNVLPVPNDLSASNADQPCVASILPPRLWRVGERLSASLTVALPVGTRTVQAWARPRVRLAPGGQPQGDVKVLDVVTPTFTITVR